MKSEAKISYQSLLGEPGKAERVLFGSEEDDGGVPWIFRSEIGVFLWLGVIWLLLIYTVFKLLSRALNFRLRNL